MALALQDDTTRFDEPSPWTLQRLYGHGVLKRLEEQQAFQDTYGKRRPRMLARVGDAS